jgi:hypothetical protein
MSCNLATLSAMHIACFDPQSVARIYVLCTTTVAGTHQVAYTGYATMRQTKPRKWNLMGLARSALV